MRRREGKPQSQRVHLWGQKPKRLSRQSRERKEEWRRDRRKRKGAVRKKVVRVTVKRN